MKKNLLRLNEEEQIAVAEIVDGGVYKHSIYASKIKNSEALFEDKENIPYVYGSPRHLYVILNLAHQVYKGRFKYFMFILL